MGHSCRVLEPFAVTDPTDAAALILDEIVRAGRPCIPTSGLDPQGLAELERAGLVAFWAQHEAGQAVTLSAYAAAAWQPAALVLVTQYSGRTRFLRWLPVGTPDEPEPRARKRKSGNVVTATDLGLATMDDLGRRRATGPHEDLGAAVPRLLLSGCRAWTGRAARPPCPVCHGLPLGPSAYCLRCDRWGRDAAHRFRRRSSRPAPEPEPAAHETARTRPRGAPGGPVTAGALSA